MVTRGGKGSLILLTVLIAATLTSAIYIRSTAEDSVALGILELYNTTRTDLVTFLLQVGGVEPVMKHCGWQYEEANRSLELADKYAKAAMVSLKSSNERLASTNALKALNLLGASYSNLISCISSWKIDVVRDQPPDPIYDVMRHEMRLERLKSVVVNMKAEGANTSHIEELILQAERNLSKARISGLSGDSNGTARYLKVVDRLLSDVIDAIEMHRNANMGTGTNVTGEKVPDESTGGHPTGDHEGSEGMGGGGMTGTPDEGGSRH